jgi:hypothetical protein
MFDVEHIKVESVQLMNPVAFQDESWLALYRTAMLELERAKMDGRIKAARTEIVARVERLHTMPGLHTEERRAIEDALSGLRVLAAEEERYDAEQKRHVFDQTLQALKTVAPAVLRADEDFATET